MLVLCYTSFDNILVAERTPQCCVNIAEITFCFNVRTSFLSLDYTGSVCMSCGPQDKALITHL